MAACGGFALKTVWHVWELELLGILTKETLTPNYHEKNTRARTA